MPALHRNFDATQIAPRDNSPIPAGEYVAMIVNSEWKATKANDGKYLQLEFQVIDGEQQNRKFWERLNLENKNAQAVEIAERTLSGICHASGQLTASDSEQLHNIPMVVKLSVEKSDRGENNVVKGYKAMAKAGAAAAVVPPKAKPAAGAKPAWAR